LGQTPQTRRQGKALEFLNPKQHQYDWDNDDLADNKGLVKLDIAHPNISDKFPDVDL
jgi:hypothetical protein